MKVINVVGNQVNLCSSCQNEFPECDAESIMFGDAVGSQNVCGCDNYKPIARKMYKSEDEVYIKVEHIGVK